MKLVLFDIDGTLLTAGMAGVDAMHLAELQQHRPDYCFTDLGDIPAVLQALTRTAVGEAQ